MKHLYTILIFLVFLTNSVHANDDLEKNGSIRGHVQTSDGQSAAFVSVGIKNTSKGTMTDEDGNYRLTGVKPALIRFVYPI